MLENIRQKNTVENRTGKSGLGKNFTFLLSGVSLTMLGDGLTLIAIPWIATTLTSHTFYVSAVSAALTMPWLLFSLLAGVLIDRCSHRTLMMITSILRSVVIGALLCTIIFEWIHISILILFAFLVGMVKVIFDSTAQTAIPTVVGREQLEKANGYMFTSITTMSDIVGRGLGGILISFGLFIPLLIDTVTALLAAPLLFLMQGTSKKYDGQQSTGERTNFCEALLEGLKWVWNHAFLRWLALLNIGLTTTFSSIIAIQVLFIQENIGLGSAGFGMLMMIAAIGAVIGGQCTGYIKENIGTKNGMAASLFIMGITLGSVGLMQSWIGVAVLYLIGNFSVVVWNVFRLSLLQRIVPEDRLGRVLSVFRFVSWGMSPIGMLLGGLIVSAGSVFFEREFALRLPYIVFILVQLSNLFFLLKIIKKETL